MNLPQEVRYRPYKDWTSEEMKALKEKVQKSPWHATYHIEPKTGLLNDPNGFSYFNGKYHLFYQNWPYGPAHGLKSWVHTESDDLIHFEETGVILYPDTKNDSHGAYSGSAYPVDDKLFIFYTGNVRDENWIRDPLQIGAFMNQNREIEKFDDVLIKQPSDVTEHFRDPQIFSYKDNFYAIVGAQSLDKKGFIKLYQAVNNDIKNWHFIGDLDFDGKGSEYMIECPNLVFVDEYPVLLYSPQGLAKSELEYENIYPNTYKIYQSFDINNCKLTQPSPIHNLDFGFEAYATQAFNTPDGRALAVSWIGLPDIDYPTDDYGYQGAMSLVKELHIKNGKLYQQPVHAIKELRQTSKVFSNLKNTNNVYELELTVPKQTITELVLFADDKENGLKLTIDTINGNVILDRSNVGTPYAIEFGTTRHCTIDTTDTDLQIFVDKSIIEIFINEGEKVFTSRVFPNTNQNGIKLQSGQATGKYYELKL